MVILSQNFLDGTYLAKDSVSTEWSGVKPSNNASTALLIKITILLASFDVLATASSSHNVLKFAICGFAGKVVQFWTKGSTLESTSSRIAMHSSEVTNVLFDCWGWAPSLIWGVDLGRMLWSSLNIEMLH